MPFNTFFLLLLTLYKPSNSPARDDEDLSSKENDDLIEIFLFKLTLIILTIFFYFSSIHQLNNNKILELWIFSNLIFLN